MTTCIGGMVGGTFIFINVNPQAGLINSLRFPSPGIQTNHLYKLFVHFTWNVKSDSFSIYRSCMQ